jgi:branched-chain amino acid transport system ATP-binding protein
MQATLKIIRNEHRHVYRVVHLLDQMVRDHGRGQAPDFEVMSQIVEYLDQFVDRFHHPKEDRYLFARLRQRAPESHAILDELEEEHRQCPGSLVGLRRALERFRAGEPGGEAAFMEAVRDYLAFQTKHLQKEEGVVIPMARQALTDEDWAEIGAAFADNQDPLFGESARAETREKFLGLVNSLPAPYGLG